MSMKTNVILSLLFGLFITVQACAQTTPTTDSAPMTRRERLASVTPEQRADRQTAQMKKRLALTAEQEPTVAAINLKYAKQMQTLIETGGRNRQTLKQISDITESKDAELKTVFTADQYKQYETLRDEQKDRVKEMRGKRNNR